MAKTKPTLFEQLQQGEQVETAREKLGVRYSGYMRLVVILLTVIIAAALFPAAETVEISDEQNARSMIGLVWLNETVRTEYSFPITKPQQQYAEEARRAREQEPPVFTRSRTPLSASVQALSRTIESVSNYLDGLTDNQAFMPYLSERSLILLRNMDAPARRRSLAAIGRKVENYLTVLARQGYINIPREQIAVSTIVLRLNSVQQSIIPTAGLVDSAHIIKSVEAMAAGALSTAETAIALDIMQKIAVPNLVYSNELTEQARKAAEYSVPRTIGIVRAGEILIAKGDRITEQALNRLRSYGNARYLLNKQNLSWLAIVGNIGHASCIYAVLLWYLYYIRRRMFDDALQLGGLSAAFLASGIQAFATVNIDTSAPLQLAVMTPAVAMLAAIIFDSRTAFYATVASALLVAGIRGGDYPTALTLTTAGMMAAYTVKDIESRTQIFRSVFYIFTGLIVPTFALDAARSWEWREVGAQSLTALINSAISPLLTFGLLFVIERVFNIATNLRLQEFDNLNHPLLLELNEKAPGTYQHTLTIARLAESAAQAIGGNALLAKTGAYYHDIGKIEKAEYFVENQLNIGNKHDRLSPRKSAGIIKDHVQEGVELARQYKLPQRITDFIPMHHGTMLIKHFYAQAVADAAESGQTVNESDFRYSGPKPRTREAAIVMLADAAEALSRIVKADDREDIEETLEKIFRDRLSDGQFDECDITTKDLVKIRETFARNLVGMHHHRIAYKELPAEPEEPVASEGE
ncbi:HDIG domain-containing protein [Ignavibacteria bacterium]|nr:HDIG domain-containing protein [Bacteroidota bacterium]MCZ2133740.1 HDIG domain-containing protein [Bacteroidota bacterium]